MEIVEHYHEVLDVLANLFVYIFNQLNENDQALLETVRAQHPFEPLQYSQDTLVLTHREAVDMLKAEGVEIGYYDDFRYVLKLRFLFLFYNVPPILTPFTFFSYTQYASREAGW